MSATSYLADVFTRHQIHLQRLAGGERNRLLPLLDQMLQSIQIEMLNLDEGSYRVDQLTRMDRLIRGIVSGTFDDMAAQALEQVDEFAQYESEFTVKALNQVVNAPIDLPSPEQLTAIITQRQATLVSGKKIERMTLKELWDTLSESKTDEIARFIQTGFTTGRTHNEIVRDLRRNLNGRTTQQISAVVRTSVNHMATEARRSVYLKNSRLIDSVMWVATLDGRTSDVCRSRDMKIYPIDSGPRPPAHYACRSTTVPVVKEKYRVPVKGTRSSTDGQVSEKTTYNSWLQKQPADFQDDVLGPKRAKLFREGGLHMDKFVDDEGRTLTLQQLREREPLAFDRAGL